MREHHSVRPATTARRRPSITMQCAVLLLLLGTVPRACVAEETPLDAVALPPSEDVSSASTVVVTMASKDYIGLLQPWVRRIKAVGIEDFVIVAQDKETLAAAEELAPGRVRIGYNEDKGTTASGTAGKKSAYGNKAWKEAVENKARYVWHVIARNQTALYSDIDVIFLHNPLKYLESHVVSIGMPYGNDIDEPNFNSGFIYAKPTPQTQEVMRKWKSLSKEIWRYKSPPYDQRALNEAIVQTNTKFPDIVELPLRLFQYAPDCRALPQKCKKPYVVHFLGYSTPASKRTGIDKFLSARGK
ncbi:hypothetical protein PTSG_09887 [Salpingoeca rosetta]|uniref:Nucleotide-diphospho-sugar transferase domain-containing protein n=1 Tax=Salpingoeca rosetta (strain ATCC 50818 / BSB-021) TaxID=946362 RepID=F2UNF1_SALR5|nr:uncharacterized protein PTSG_09887 [Salpingoeca rosetta]EGD79156.1 hypothetical protein PTSG_09887 [Salpingoeca rosetta]|eukprot:XP_004989241.1 hypothetical protein PTSG_09887 [Salpingoeca rosetta]